jgi:hypothetical protein
MDIYTKRAAEALKAIRKNPEHWDQGSFRNNAPIAPGKCGTTMCFAGWVCDLDPDSTWDSPWSSTVVVDGQYFPASQRAKQLLGGFSTESILEFSFADLEEENRAIAIDNLFYTPSGLTYEQYVQRVAEVFPDLDLEEVQA